MAHPALALQREGALGARLQGHRAPPPGARRRLPDPRRGARPGAARCRSCSSTAARSAIRHGSSARSRSATRRRALYPHDAAARQRALALEDYFDEQLGPALRAAIVTPLFRHDPDLALRALTTGMPDKAYQTLRPLVRIFPAFYRFRHKISDANLEADRATVRGRARPHRAGAAGPRVSRRRCVHGRRPDRGGDAVAAGCSRRRSSTRCASSYRRICRTTAPRCCAIRRRSGLRTSIGSIAARSAEVPRVPAA